RHVPDDAAAARPARSRRRHARRPARCPHVSALRMLRGTGAAAGSRARVRRISPPRARGRREAAGDGARGEAFLQKSSERERRGARRSLVDSCSRLIRHLGKKNDILLLPTSTRFRKDTWDIPKTTQLAWRLRDHLAQRKKRVTLLDVPELTIHTCEGNV